MQHVERFESRDDDRLVIIARDEIIRFRTDDHADVARADERVELEIARIEDRPQRRDDRNVVAEDGKVADALALGLQDGERGRGRGRLEAECEEHDLSVGILAREGERIERRVDHPDVRAVAFRLQQRLLGTRDAHRVAEGREDHLGPLGDRDAVVDATHR